MKYYDYNVTAVSPDDYMGVSDEIIQFNVGDTYQIHRVIINQDDDCENDPDEIFTSILVLASGEQPIQVIEPNATVYINDSVEPECSK